MRAAILPDKGRPLEIETRPDPVAGPGQLVLRVEASGICGSDLHAAENFSMPGVLMGHEFCGTVEEVGPDVTDWQPGDRAVGFPLVGCGTCAACLEGRIRKCFHCQMIGFDLPGAYAEYVTVGARETDRLPEGFDPRLGALIEPLSVGLHAVDRAGLRPGDDVLVLGGGPVGLAVVLWLRHLGAREIAVSDPIAHRRELAETVGATLTIDPTKDDVADRFVHATGMGPRVVIECVGIPGLIQHAIDVAAVDATVAVCGVCMEMDSVLPLIPITKELDLRFTFYYRMRDYRTTIDLIHQERLDPSPLITDECDLDALPERFEALKHPTHECKVLVRP